MRLFAIALKMKKDWRAKSIDIDRLVRGEALDTLAFYTNLEIITKGKDDEKGTRLKYDQRTRELLSIENNIEDAVNGTLIKV